MCGRFVQALPPEKIVDYFGADPASVARSTTDPNYNVAPSQQILNVLLEAAHAHQEELSSGAVHAVQSPAEKRSEKSEHGEGVKVAQRILWGMLFPWAK